VATLSAAEAAVLDAVDPAEVVRDLEALVAIPSVGGSAAESDAQAWTARRLAAAGCEVDHWQLDVAALRVDPGYPGEEVHRSEAWGCVGTVPAAGEGSPALVLCGHTDVVPPGALAAWEGRDPWRLTPRDGALWGRGTCDMKGGLAAVLGAVSALRRSRTRLARPLAVHAVVGEEDGGLGAFGTLVRGHGGDACVIAEPTSGRMVVANSGALTFRLEVEGLAVHGSLRASGVSAVDELVPVLEALRDLETRRNARPVPLFEHLELVAPLSVGIVRAGDWASTVPDLVVVEGRYGVLPDEPVEAARAEFEEAVALACDRRPWLRDHPARIAWEGGQFASGRLPEGHPLGAEVAGAVGDARGGEPPAAVGFSTGSDLRQYAAAGIATLLCGPGDFAHAHSVEEQVRPDDVVDLARAYALLALRRCGAA
jgi:acetylornithine deacetylase